MGLALASAGEKRTPGLRRQTLSVDNSSSGNSCKTEEKEFEVLLRTCTCLQRILDDAQPSGTESRVPDLLHSMTHELDAAGRDLMNAINEARVLPSPSTRSTIPSIALLSLVTATSLKLLEICHHWTEIVNCDAVFVHQALLLKRIHGNLMQVRTVLSNVSPLDSSFTPIARNGLGRTVDLHEQIQARLQGHWGDMQELKEDSRIERERIELWLLGDHRIGILHLGA